MWISQNSWGSAHSTRGGNYDSEWAALLMKVAERGQWRQSAISNIWSWLQAYFWYMAVMLSAETTSKEEAAGLAAHMHLILRLSRDLGGILWLRYA